MSKRPRVILRRCPDYDVDRISGIIQESMQMLACRVAGDVFLKPNVVTANRRYIHNSYTHPDVTEAMVNVLRQAYAPESLCVGESGGYGIPSRLFFKESGYMDLAKRIGIDLYDLNEHKQVKVKLAAERGYGSLSLDDIDISGDVDLETLRAIPKGNTRLFQHLDELDTPIRFFNGRAPGTDLPCDGGCECALKGCLGTIEKRTPGALKNARKGAIVTGIYAGDVIMPDGPVLLVGDCTRVEGRLDAARVSRIKGCPMGARDLFIKVPLLFKVPSPMLDPRDATLFVLNSVAKGWHILKNRYLTF